MGAQWKAKHKEAAAKAKGRIFGKLAKELQIAARNGADPDMNPRLRLAVEQAKKASMPKDTLERAINKGAGLSGDVVQYTLVKYEGFAPHQVPLIVECLTDNVKRTVAEIRVLFRKGQLGAEGSVSWDFNHCGMIEAAPATPGADPELAAIEAGAQDFEPAEEGATLFLTEATDVDAVQRPCRITASPWFPPRLATWRKTRSRLPMKPSLPKWKRSSMPSTGMTTYRTCTSDWPADPPPRRLRTFWGRGTPGIFTGVAREPTTTPLSDLGKRAGR